LKRRDPDSAFLPGKKDLPLSGPALAELMQAVLHKNVPFRFRAGGFSMVPFIKDGDVLTVAPFPEHPPGVGRVAAFLHPVSGTLAVHRIVAQKKSGYRLKGDSTDVADGLVPRTHMIGIIRKVERNGRKILMGLGPERFLIAFLSGTGLLAHLLYSLGLLVQTLRGVR
jgi:hypothetical protein